ncbi:hypothetical protein POPTR_018G003201v4 [Populus trichocarpa]|uniref:Uncharacterized protein n=1 Tax=Populus trichocarpa TaxID=3694 RepID=A0ACC0RLF0_POPTR|nr:hypothetical protein BDE02_18G002800 [Populus trichocarpa]KAI9377899.1 hypothetical protein POPTR_018G003201v4 [Populus trichocarpa]
MTASTSTSFASINNNDSFLLIIIVVNATMTTASELSNWQGLILEQTTIDNWLQPNNMGKINNHSAQIHRRRRSCVYIL